MTQTYCRLRRFSQRDLLWCSFLLAGVSAVFAAPVAHAQDTEATFSQIPPSAADAAVARLAESILPTTASPANAADATREVSWKKLPVNILDDQKNLWLFPTQLAHGHHWLPTIGVVGVTAVFIDWASEERTRLS